MLCLRCGTRKADFIPVRITSATLRTTDGVERPVTVDDQPANRTPICRPCLDAEVDEREGAGAAARMWRLAAAMGKFMDDLPRDLPMREKARLWQAHLATEAGRELLRDATQSL